VRDGGGAGGASGSISSIIVWGGNDIDDDAGTKWLRGAIDASGSLRSIVSRGAKGDGSPICVRGVTVESEPMVERGLERCLSFRPSVSLCEDFRVYAAPRRLESSVDVSGGGPVLCNLRPRPWVDIDEWGV
jgi:hypothetical protein